MPAGYNERQDPMTRTMEIPTCRAWTLRARCKDDAIRNYVRVYVPAEAAKKPDRLRAIGRRYNGRIVCSKAFRRVPGAESRNALCSKMPARARRKTRRLPGHAL